MTVESKEQVRFNNVCDFLLARNFITSEQVAELLVRLDKLELTRIDNDFYKRSQVEIDRNKDFDNLYDSIESLVLGYNEKFFQYDVKGFEKFKYLIYEEGDFHLVHQDQSNFYNNRFDRKISFTLQLSEPENYDGGDFQFQKIGGIYQPIPRKSGCLVTYSSAIPHRVLPVTRGRRQAIVGYIYGPPLI